MRKASCKTHCGAIARQLLDIRMRGHERQSAAHALRQADAFVDAVIRVKEAVASFGAMFSRPRPGYKH